MANVPSATDPQGKIWDILNPESAKVYRIASHARTDALEREIPETERSYPALLARRVAAMPDVPLVTIGDVSLTAAQLQDQAARLAGTLLQAGVAKDEKVAILCGNKINFPTLVAAISWIGAVSVPINTASRGLQLQHILSSSEAKVLIIERSLLVALTTIDRNDLAIETIYVLDENGETLPEGLMPFLMLAIQCLAQKCAPRTLF